MMLESDSTNNMSGGVYISGWFLIAMGLRLWPALFWGPLGIISTVYTLIGAIWSLDTLNRWKWPTKRKLVVMLGIPVAVLALIMLVPVTP